jgi:hypothetical protein
VLTGLAGLMAVVPGRPAAAVELAVEELTVENARGGATAEVGAELYIRCRVSAHGADAPDG